MNILNKLYHSKIDTWDYQWNYCIRINNGLAIIPTKNLVVNLGFSAEASHTKKDKRLMQNSRKRIEFPLKHPMFKLIDEKRDFEFFQEFVRRNNIISSFKKCVLKVLKNT
jgi:hypothetical protein